MRCPWCGSPVMIRGRRWECGYCGDFGDLQEVPHEQTETPVITIEFPDIPEENPLPELWSRYQEACGDLNLRKSSQAPARNAFLYQISLALSQHRDDPDKLRALDEFLRQTPDISQAITLSDLLRAAESGKVLLEEHGVLSEKDWGVFWQLLDRDSLDPEDLFPILGRLWEFFDPSADCWDRAELLEDTYAAHCRRRRLFCPDTGPALQRLREGDTGRLDEDCRDILAAAFPDYFSGWQEDDLEDCRWDSLLEALLTEHSSLALRMWNSLLEAIGPHPSPDTLEALWDSCPFSREDWDAYKRAGRI